MRWTAVSSLVMLFVAAELPACVIHYASLEEALAEADAVVVAVVEAREGSAPSFSGPTFFYRVLVEESVHGEVEPGAYPASFFDSKMHQRGDMTVCPLKMGSGIEPELEADGSYVLLVKQHGGEAGERARWLEIVRAEPVSELARVEAQLAPAAAPAAAGAGRFQIAILAEDWFDLGSSYDWEEIWPDLRQAARQPLLVVDEDDLVAYDWREQRLVLRPEVGARLLARLHELPGLSKRLQKLQALWLRSDLWWALHLRGFVVSLDGEPLYGGIFLEAPSPMAVGFPTCDADLDAGRRIVLALSPINFPWGCVWEEGAVCPEPPAAPVDAQAQADREWFRAAHEDKVARDGELIAASKRRILDPRVRELLAELGIRAVAPPPPPAAPAAAPTSRPPFAVVARQRAESWELKLDFADPEAIAEVRLRFEPGGEWKSRGLEADVETGEHASHLRERLAPEWVARGRLPIEVQLVDWSGRPTGPFTIWFDAAEWALTWARYELGHAGNVWISFAEPDRRRAGLQLDVSTLVPFRESLAEIRYSLDGCDLGQRLDGQSLASLDSQTASVHGNGALPIPEESSYACVQLLFTDGATTETRRFYRHPESAPLPPVGAGEAEPFRLAARNEPYRDLPRGSRTLAYRAARRGRHGFGWWIFLDLAEDDSPEIAVRFPGEAWRSTGLAPWSDPATGLPYPVTTVPVPAERVRPGRQRLDVELRRPGAAADRYTIWFDAEREMVEQARDELEDGSQPWPIFYDRRGDRTVLDFRNLTRHRDALREIRYSIDDCDLDERFTLEPWTDLIDPPPVGEETERSFPVRVAFVCLQLVYRDGVVSEPRRFTRPESEVSNHATDPSAPPPP